ncbi:DeoR/GlpR family DNA-binding transcription regulator [Psychromonas hadalis]|uniref:DeoR/GlpR family DNA-binding transcription regulator n=1 Tax=Psychromonas hadalis TaxID=211669 RepID=UPI0003B6EE85|nr:DeoR/GlpR family DNA-binding transcription regulator [Psychromonas hadalis]
MIPVERQRTILSLLSQQEVISISELVKQLNVSHMTIRRDIIKLELSGKVMSVSGGVQLTKAIYSEPSHDVKIEHQAEQKMLIAQIAVKLISANSTIYLDAGTTSLKIAHQLSHRDDLRIITNDFAITAYLINHSQCEVYHTGGKVDRKNQSAIGGKVSMFLLSMNIDIAFISTSSWNLKGLSTPTADKIQVKDAIAKSSQITYLISDSSKYGKVATFHALDINKLNGVITDSGLADNIISELREQGIEVYYQ